MCSICGILVCGFSVRTVILFTAVKLWSCRSSRLSKWVSTFSSNSDIITCDVKNVVWGVTFIEEIANDVLFMDVLRLCFVKYFRNNFFTGKVFAL